MPELPKNETGPDAMARSRPDTDPADVHYSTAIERRLIALEEKASYGEDLVDALNATVARQQQQIESLAREIARLRQQLGELAERSATGDPGDEVPPHY